SAAETIAMLAEHRTVRPLKLRSSREERILALIDAILASGERAVAHLLAWSRTARSSGNVWAMWPAVFLLGSLDGPRGLRAIEDLLEELPEDEAPCGWVAADALSAAPHPDVPLLARDLVESPHAVARSVGLEVLSRRGAADPEQITCALAGDAPSV